MRKWEMEDKSVAAGGNSQAVAVAEDDWLGQVCLPILVELNKS